MFISETTKFIYIKIGTQLSSGKFLCSSRQRNPFLHEAQTKFNMNSDVITFIPGIKYKTISLCNFKFKYFLV